MVDSIKRSDVSRVMSASMKFAEEYYKKVGFTVKNVASLRGEVYSGYDLLVQMNGSAPLKVEVKGTRGTGIPDAHDTEFTSGKNPKFKADVLCLVRLDNNYELKDLVILSNCEINSERFKHKTLTRYRFSSRLKRDLNDKKIGEIISRKSVLD